ncbi:MAG TPA: DCC1-like thiol-disulfide oxidoreductase family protein [Bacteroidales bacterium]|nr:DCC1-like thiol-disulfide oxidoreductase family protein [Bacteroidales bacterium]
MKITNFSSPYFILFDGYCNLCNGFVRWLIRRDKSARFRFLPLQSAEGKQLLQLSEMKFDPSDDPETVILYHDGTIWERSEAILEIFKILGGGLRLMAPLKYLPLAWRDKLYNFVARNRYRWFGRRDQCMIPGRKSSQ